MVPHVPLLRRSRADEPESWALCPVGSVCCVESENATEQCLYVISVCLCVGGRELMSRNPGRYAQLLTISNDKVDMEIMRDLNRTFPNHVFFFQRQGPGQQSLFHVLRAYSSHDRQVGVMNWTR